MLTFDPDRRPHKPHIFRRLDLIQLQNFYPRLGVAKVLKALRVHR